MVRDQPILGASIPVLYLDEQRIDADGMVLEEEPGCLTYALYSSTCQVNAILQEPLDVLARAMHRHYDETRRRQGIEAGTDPRRAQWERLRADVKEQFRIQADHVQIKLHTVGCDLFLEKVSGERYILTEEEILTLARMEHRRQVAEALLSFQDKGSIGLLRASERGIPGWGYLSEKKQEENRKLVECIPEILQMVGMKIQQCL